MIRPEFPLFKRELIGLLRTRKAFWIVMISLLLASLMPLLAWPSRSMAFTMGTENVWTFLLFFFTQLTTALFMIPAVTAGAIAGERERDTYDALYSTLLRPSSIALSKALVSSGFVAIVLVCSSPAVFVLYLLGGLGFASILKCYAVTLSAMVASSLVSLHRSMQSRTTAQAAVRGVVSVLFWNIGLFFVLYLGFGLWASLQTGPARNPAYASIAATALFSLSPYVAIGSEVLPVVTGVRSFLAMEPWILYVGLAGLLSLASFLRLLRRARTPDQLVATRRERRLARRGAASRPVRRSAFTNALISCSDSGFPLIANPVFAKELRSEFFSRLAFRRWCFWVPLILFSGLACLRLRSTERVAIIACVTLTFLAILVPAVAASAFPREVEQGNLDFLRGTKLTLREILTGKLLSTLFSYSGIFAAAWWVCGAVRMVSRFTETSRRDSSSVPWIASWETLILAVTLLFVAAVSTLASTLAKKTLNALVIAYGLVLCVFLVWPILVVMTNQGDRGIGDVLSVTSPYGALVKALNYSSNETPTEAAGFVLVFGTASFILWLLSAVSLEARHARDV